MKGAIWGGNQGHGERLTPTEALDQAVADGDIISCATPAEQPLVKGKQLKPGTHVDLIGGFTPTMREADDEAIAGHGFMLIVGAACEDLAAAILAYEQHQNSRD